MKNLCRKIWLSICGVWKIHIGISSAVSLIVIAVILYQFLLKDWLSYLFGKLSSGYDPSSLFYSVLIGIASSFAAALLFGLFGIFILNWYSKIRLTGSYKAYAVNETGHEEEWGTVTIKYHPLSINTHHTPVKLSLRFKDVFLEGDGLIVDNRYLIGHYCETEKTERRRAGAFMYQLDGSGTTWSGGYTYIDTNTADPKVAKAVWRRC